MQATLSAGEARNSTHKVEVVPVRLEKHPNADSLSICRVFNYTVCCRTEDWKGIERAAYLPPDSLADTRRPEFSFLENDAKYTEDCSTPGPFARIKVKKLRGVISYGLLVPAPDGVELGSDVAELLGVAHYNPPEPLSTKGEAASGPPLYSPKYDIDSFMRYAHLFRPCEPVWVTEKLHGANARYVYSSSTEKIYCGSRTEFKKESTENLWWKALEVTPVLRTFLLSNPDIVVYGEVYGQVQSLKYGAKPGQVKFAAFDLLRGTEWMPPEEAQELGKDLPWVPFLGKHSFNPDTIMALATGNSMLADHIREGCVVKPLTERQADEIGRVQLKVINPDYYSH